jgi:hypothetical protein
MEERGGWDALLDSMSSASAVSSKAFFASKTAPLEGSLWRVDGICACLVRRRFQRFFVLRGSRLMWWRQSALAHVPIANCAARGYRFCGFVDLSADDVQVEAVDGSSSAFKLWPRGGRWEASCFLDRLGVRGSIVLDAEGSEYTREEWLRGFLAAQISLSKSEVQSDSFV